MTTSTHAEAAASRIYANRLRGAKELADVLKDEARAGGIEPSDLLVVLDDPIVRRAAEAKIGRRKPRSDATWAIVRDLLA
jgi:hypothetical protein